MAKYTKVSCKKCSIIKKRCEDEKPCSFCRENNYKCELNIHKKRGPKPSIKKPNKMNIIYLLN